MEADASTANSYAGTLGGTWRSTAAVTRVTLFPSSLGNFVAGSRLTVYGLS